MSEEKRLSSEGETFGFSQDGIIGGDGIPVADSQTTILSTLSERISHSTEKDGLNSLPSGFDDFEGDWKIINSSNPFETLYLDYKQYKIITPQLVKKNYDVLEKFWKEKYAVMNTGGNRSAFKSKYGDGTVENCLVKLKREYDKLSSEKGISDYYLEINNARLKKGEQMLLDSIDDMLADEVADRSEIELRLERGLKYDLDKPETAEIIKKFFDARGFKPYGKTTGNSIIEQLLSVDWMTDKKIAEKKIEEEEKKKRGREIFENEYAYSIEDIGEIIFKNEKDTKEYIAEGLITSSIDYFSSAKAKQIVDIIKARKDDEHNRYLQIVYRLNTKLPYRLTPQKLAASSNLLSVIMHETLESVKLGKEHIKKGYIETWLLETDKDSHQKLIKIRDGAENIDLAFIEFIYTFNSTLPYRFAEKYLVQTPVELSAKIDENSENWESGITELYNKYVLVWLNTTDHKGIISSWDKVNENNKFQIDKNPDVGLEEFLHILNPELSIPELKLSITNVSFPGIQSGQSEQVEVVFSNETRGYVEGNINFSTPIDGVFVSDERVVCSRYHEGAQTKRTLTIDTSNLVKGVPYETILKLTPSIGKPISLPIGFKVVFPTNAFVLEILKWAAIVSAFMVGTRYSIQAIGYSGWLREQFDFYLNWGVKHAPPQGFNSLAVIFFFFSTISIAGIYFLIQYLLKKNVVPINKSPKPSETKIDTTVKKENPISVEQSTSDIDINKQVDIFYKSGVVLHKAKDFDGAIKDYNKALKLNPNHALALFARGIAKYDSDDKDGAYNDWTKSSKLGHAKSTELLKKYFK